MSINNAHGKAEALANDLTLLIEQTKENLNSRGYDTIREFAFQPSSYPISLEVYEAVFKAAFAAGEQSGKVDLATKIVGYLKK